MAKNTSVTLGEHFDSFISQQLETGRYGSASEVLRAGLRALEDQELKMNNLRNMLVEGENSGIADYSYDTLLSDLGELPHRRHSVSNNGLLQP
ncbi:type II toxin-antitoxin system ParD family antitoxin [Pseudoalteromonas sp. APM04]|jgi:antitoxin ParD1/3/4|uniref:type II toxin-antitoxin system ParD family antitoxin n=1 Tax=Pseudoalteromonas sp. APM04 TaxID=2699396 RepID=UPI001FB467FF|nr:type II toxin-antitoxin system ParD family antitoxin [Pseudoalteromonas sp. APM04]UOB73988.1 type II toxin-antitoxin system ParD family antitoxin [Pseudoalteromonas sp. APM04]